MRNIVLLTLILLTGCNSGSSDDEFKSVTKDTSAIVEDVFPVPSIKSGCYGYVVKKDSAFLKLDISGNIISGDLTYSLHQKDSNKGTINGILQDSLLIADYTFQAEGMTSVRQVVFKMRGDSLLEGFGDIDMKGDTATFKNIDELQFQDYRSFIKIDCK